MIVRAALGLFERLPQMKSAETVEGWILSDACRWYALEAVTVDRSDPRSRFGMTVVEHGTLREFSGFNRAKHAVVEATILATRTKWIAEEDIRREIAKLTPLVEKTGGCREKDALELVNVYLDDVFCRRHQNS